MKNSYSVGRCGDGYCYDSDSGYCTKQNDLFLDPSSAYGDECLTECKES